MTRPKIVVLDGYTLNPGDLSWAPLEELGELEIHERSGQRVVQHALDADCVLTNKAVLGAQQLRCLRKLRYVGVLATGTNVVDLDEARSRGITVTNVPGYSTPSVVQHTLALLLELTNHAARHAAAVRDGAWTRSPDFSFRVAPVQELADLTLGIVGLGSIGQGVAKAASALGMRVRAAHQRSMDSVSIPGVEVQWCTLDELLASSDVVSLHCPLTDDTRQMIDRDRLSAMRKNAILINTARGGLVDEKALLKALNQGDIAAAALDVLSDEPPRGGNGLLGHPRCLVTPHIAWGSLAARQRLMNLAAANLRAFLSGEPLNVVT